MRPLRIISFGVLLWVLIFVEISITMIGLQLSQAAVWIVHYVVMIPLASLCAWRHYKSNDTTNGFLVGLVVVVVGVVLDLILTVPLFVVPAGGSYATYLSNLWMWAGVVEAVVIVGLYDLLRKKN